MTTEQRNTYNRVDLNEPLYTDNYPSSNGLFTLISILAVAALLLAVSLMNGFGVGGLGIALIGFIVFASTSTHKY